MTIPEKQRPDVYINEEVLTLEQSRFILGFLDGILPTERIHVSDWSNKYRILSREASARPGPYDVAQTPYLREILDCLSEMSPIQKVIFMKGAQVGATEVGNNWIGYIIHVAPAATLMVMPTDDTVRTNSQIRIDPMINDSPVLRQRIGSARNRSSRNTTAQKAFPGGVLLFKGANSPVALRSLPCKNIMLDELDAYPQNIGGEGSGAALAEARTMTYAHSKIYMVSTPGTKGKSAIEFEYEDSDKRRYYVPCPHCGTMQTIEWGRIEWESDDKPETAKLRCEASGCATLIDERYKFDMITAGQWIATNPEHPDKTRRGYHISALYSTLGYKWESAVKSYLQGKRNMEKMITFVNTVLGESWVDAVDAPDWEALYNRRSLYEQNRPPAHAAFLTCGVDIQRDRIELEIVAWCKNKVSYSIDYRVLLGDTNASDVWDQLDAVINETWEREDGALMPLSLTAIDTGYNTQEVYAFCRRYDNTKVVPVKGRDELMSVYGRPQEVDITGAGKNVVGTIKLYSVGVSVIKSELYGWLRQFKLDGKEDPIGYCYFPQYAEGYFKMLTAEQKLLTKDKKTGRDRYIWTLPSRARNEALDCRVYARAAAGILQMDRFEDKHWELKANEYPMKQDIENPIPAVKPARKRDDFMNGRGGKGFL